MPFIVTPNQLNQRAEFYYQLGSLLSAGVPVMQALEQLRRNPPSRSLREPLAILIQELQSGQTFVGGLMRSGKWMPSFDLALLRAGEQSGRLDACFKLLGNYYRDRAQMVRRVIGQLIYPVMLFHFAFLIFPIQRLTDLVWKGDIVGFLTQKISILPLYAGILILIYLCQGERGEAWRAVVESVTRAIPFLGKAQRELALARLSAALEALISAGVSVFNAWEIAAAASGSPALRRVILTWRPQLERGRTPSELLRSSREFPDLFANLYHSGEISGQQDDTLKRLYIYYQEEGTRKLEMFAQWFPRLIYFGIVIMVAYQVIGFWTKYYSNLFRSF